MNKIILSFIAVILSCLDLAAQEISGLVVNEDNEPIEYASVALMDIVDSTFVVGGMTDADGKFNLDIGTHGTDGLVVRVTSVGYEAKFAALPLDGPIQMEPISIELADVMITGIRKYVKTNATGLTVEMVGNPLSKLPNATDAIRMMPMIDTSKSGISVLGKGSPEIYINNRKVRNPGELNQLSPENIKSVDIITTPSAKYGASVTSVIIIHTKKHDEGLAGVVQAFGSVIEQTTGGANADLSYMMHNGLGFFLGGNIMADKYEQNRRYSEDFNDNMSHSATTGTYYNKDLSIKLTTGSSYDFSEYNSVGFRYEFSRTPKNKYYANSDINLDIDGIEDQMSSNNTVDIQSMRHYLNAYATFKFGKKKNYELSADADYLYGSNKDNQNTVENDHGQENDITTMNRAYYHLAATKANMNMAFGKVAIDVGGEYSYTTNRTNFGSIVTGTPFYADDYVRQNLSAGYVNVVYTPSKYWTLSAGLRVEATDFTYYQNGERIDGQSGSYTDWLPKLNVGYGMGDWKFGLSYNSNAYRPSYSMLNNNSTYTSHTLWETGNSLLRSSNPFNIGLNVSWKRTYFSATYYRIKHQIEYVYNYIPEYGINLRKPENLPDFNKFIFTMSHSMDVGLWHPMLQGTLVLNNLKYGTPQNAFNKPIGSVSFQNRFDLPWGIYAYLTGSWSSKGNNNIYYFYDDASVYIYLVKSVGNWSFSVYANDIFDTQKFKHLTSTNGVNVLEDRKGASRFVQLSVTYSFNKKHKKSYKGKGTGSSELQRF